MNSKEKAFLDSIKEKIEYYEIETTPREAILSAQGQFYETSYSNGLSELVDVGVERFLCEKSAYYFIDRYAWIDLPGTGVIPFGLYYFQKETLKLLPKTKKTVYLKSRQCLTEDNFVMTDKGYISIKDVKPGDKIETLINDKPTMTLVENFYNQGKKETCRILTNSGAEINCTLDHEVLTKDGWKEAQEITLDDEIVSSIGKGQFGNFKLERDEHAALIGYYLADGKWEQPYFVNTNLEYAEEVLNAGLLFENCNPYIYTRKETKNRKIAYEARLVSKSKSPTLNRPIKKFLKKFNLATLSVERNLTKELMNLNKHQMSILLNRLYAGDGWITYNKDKRKPNYISYEIGLGSPCFSLIKQIEYILQTKYNIHCSVQYSPFNGNDFWKLRVWKKKSVIKFVDEVGIKGKTDKEDIKLLLERERPYKSNQSFEKVKKLERKKELEDVYDITTSTNDFLANGLVVHNCGISTLTSLYCLWRGNFQDSENIDVISTKQQKAQAFVSKMDPTIKRMPEFLKTLIVNKNASVIKWSNGSHILSETASDRAGRGDSLSLLILDEAAHYQTDRLTRGIVAAAMPTLARTGGSSIIISTPNGTSGSGSYYYEQVNSLQINGNSIKEKLVEIDWYEIPDLPGIEPYKGFNEDLDKFIAKDYFNNPGVKQKMREHFSSITENWRDNEWLTKQHEDLGDVLFKQEVLHSFIIADDQVFPEEVLEKVKDNVSGIVPIWENKLNTNPVKGMIVWELPKPKHRYILGCLPPGEKVLTNSGLKNIESVSVEDKLVSKNGSFVDIKNIQRYQANENLYKIKLEGILRQTSFTGEHPLLVSKHNIKRKHGESRFIDYDFCFTNVSDVEKGDWIIYPNVYNKNLLTEKQIKEKWNFKSGRKDFDLNPDIILDEDFWWFIGIWLAEGWTQTRGFSKSIHTCHNIKTEKKYAEKIREIFKKYERKVSFVQKENVVETVFNSSQLFKFLDGNFKKYASKKEVPEWIKRAPRKFKIKLIEGYLNGDGSIFIDKRESKYKTSFVSTSQNLIEGIQDILFSLGYISNAQILRRKGTTTFPSGKVSDTKETYQLNMSNEFSVKLMKELKIPYDKTKENNNRRSISLNNFKDDLTYIYLKVKSVSAKEYNGPVYNFETEDHTYLCNYLTTHNCDVGSGTSKDFSTIQVMDVESYAQVAEYKGKMSTKLLGRLVKMVAKYYNQGFVVIEANSIGEAVFNEVYYHDTDPYDNVYKQKKQKNGVTRMTGWETNVKSRQLMTNNIIDWFTVDDLFNQMTIRSQRLYQELCTWVWHGSKPEHAESSNDDALIAWGLCIHLRNKADSFGESFFIGDDGGLFEYSERDSKDMKESEDGLAIAISDYEVESLEDNIKETYNVESVEQYNFLIGES